MSKADLPDGVTRPGLVSRVRTAARTRIGRMILDRRTGKGGSPLDLLPAEATKALRREGLNPLPELSELRDREPVSRLPLNFGVNVYLVTGFEAAKEVIGDISRFSNDLRNGQVDPLMAEVVNRALGASQPGGLGMADPPDHTRLRKMLQPEFTMRRLSRLTPLITGIVERQLDIIAGFGPDAPVDLVEHFALPVPSLTICELLGVTPDQQDRFYRLSVSRFDVSDGPGASLDAIAESNEYLLEEVARQRKDPGPGILGSLIRTHGSDISDLELAGLADGILVGGFETTASMIGLGAMVLLKDPAVAESLRTDDEAVGPLMEELLRHLAVVQIAFPRFAREDTVVGGVSIKAGDVMLASLPAANRDPALVSGVGKSLDTIDPTRKPTHHLAFGYGAHRCVGAELARLELRIAYPALVRRFPQMALAVPEDEVKSRQTSIVFGYERLPVLPGPSAAPAPRS